MDQSSDAREWRYLSWEQPDDLDKINAYFESQDKSAKPGASPGLPKFVNPILWKDSSKIYLGILGCVGNFSTTYTGGSYTSATKAMSKEWNVSQVAVLAGVTVFTTAFAITPMLLAPFSEINGRRPVMLVSGVVFVVGVLFCAVTRLFVGMLLARILVGMANSTFAVVIVGVVTDIHTDAQARYTALNWFTAGSMFGTGFGPLISAFIVQNTNWRWLFGVLGLFCFAMVTVFILTFRETRGPVLLARQAKIWNDWYDKIEEAGNHHNKSEEKTSDGQSYRNVRWKVESDEERKNIPQMIRLSLTRPFHLLFTEPVVFFFSLWAAFAWSIMYAMLIVVPYTFHTVYGFDMATSSGMFAAMCTATIIMVVVCSYHYDITAIVVKPEIQKTPEALLYVAGVEAILLPIGLLWFGWSANPDVHWIVPALGLGCATMGMYSVYLAVFAYLSTAYPEEASSANAAQSMVRNLMGGVFPLFSKIMFQRLGFGGACSLLGGIGVVLTFLPWTLIALGPQIRARSKLAFKDGS